MDNFFTSIPLTQTLLSRGIHLCGTLKKNKTQIPYQLLPCKSREINLNKFAFCEYSTLVSYVPKFNKAIILVSSLHHLSTISDGSESNKSEIILFYNKTKGWVDTFDQMIEHSTCRRRT